MAREKKAKSVPDNTIKAPLEEESMEEASPPWRGQSDDEEYEKAWKNNEDGTWNIKENIVPKGVVTLKNHLTYEIVQNIV